MEKTWPPLQVGLTEDTYVHINNGGGGIPLRLPFDGHVYFSRFLRRLGAQIKTRPSTVGAPQIIDDKHASPSRRGGRESARSSNSSDDDDDAAGLVLFYKRLSSESRYCINLRFPVKGISREYGVCLRARRVNFRRHHEGIGFVRKSFTLTVKTTAHGVIIMARVCVHTAK